MTSFTADELYRGQVPPFSSYQMNQFLPPPHHPAYYVNTMPLQSQPAPSLTPFFAPFSNPYFTDWNSAHSIAAASNFSTGYMHSVQMNADPQNTVAHVTCPSIGMNPSTANCNAYTNTVSAQMNPSQVHVLTMNRNSSAPSLSAITVTPQEIQTTTNANNVQLSTVRTRNSNASARNANANLNANLSTNKTSATSNTNVSADSSDVTRLQAQSRVHVQSNSAIQSQLKAAQNNRSHPAGVSTLPPRLIAAATKQAAERARPFQNDACSNANTDSSNSGMYTRDDMAPKYSILKRDSNVKRCEHDATQTGQTVSYETRLREYEAARRRILGCPISGCNCNGTCNASAAGTRRPRNTNANSHDRRPDCVVISRRCSELPSQTKAKDASDDQDTSATEHTPTDPSNSVDQSTSVDAGSNKNRSRSTSPDEFEPDAQSQTVGQCTQSDKDSEAQNESSEVQTSEPCVHDVDCEEKNSTSATPSKVAYEPESAQTSAQSEATASANSGDAASTRSAVNSTPKITILKREAR